MIERGVIEIDILLIHFLLRKFNGLAEALEVYHFALSQKADDIVDIRII